MTAPVPVPRREFAAKPTPPLYPGQEFVATFRPAARWSEAIQRHAGVRCRWRAAWQISEGCCAGELACIPVGGAAKGLAWAPESELTERA